MECANLNYSRQNYLEPSSFTELNTVDVWRPDATSVSSDDKKLWVVFIHGGAWRDPEVDSKSFVPCLKVLCQSPLMNSIAGFASINYRLSPYPSHPRQPSSPEDPSRNIHHPAHEDDVAEALWYLDRHYDISDRYLLVGHSAGATIAFQLQEVYIVSLIIPQPAYVLGVSGIYDFEAFIEAHSTSPGYEEIVLNAFQDRRCWKAAAPYSESKSKRALWHQAEAVIISHSDADELVEKGQASFMLERAQQLPQLEGKIHYLEASGAHDEIWQNGHILAGLIINVMEIIRSGKAK